MICVCAPSGHIYVYKAASTHLIVLALALSFLQLLHLQMSHMQANYLEKSICKSYFNIHLRLRFYHKHRQMTKNCIVMKRSF